MVQRLKAFLLPVGPQVRTLPVGIGRGVRMPIDFASQTRTYLGLYEVEVNRYLRQFARPPGVTAFDIGGQNGYDALVIATLTGERVQSFECQPQLAAKMRATIALNPKLRHRVGVTEAFVGQGLSELSLDEFAYGPDGFVPGLMKIDIDGGEVGALGTADRVLRERRPSLIVETHSPQLETECGRIMVEYGYAPRIVHQRGLLPDYRPTDHNRWLVAAGNDVRLWGSGSSRAR